MIEPAKLQGMRQVCNLWLCNVLTTTASQFMKKYEKKKLNILNLRLEYRPYFQITDTSQSQKKKTMQSSPTIKHQCTKHFIAKV